MRLCVFFGRCCGHFDRDAAFFIDKTRDFLYIIKSITANIHQGGTMPRNIGKIQRVHMAGDGSWKGQLIAEGNKGFRFEFLFSRAIPGYTGQRPELLQNFSNNGFAAGVIVRFDFVRNGSRVPSGVKNISPVIFRE
jgi:hypothetical protein